MKKHAIIPIFIPHLGCPHTCIFCDQNSITARPRPVTAAEIRETADTWLSTLSGVETIEMAFYGGSFTAIPLELQKKYLSVVKEYKDAGKIHKIHLSTRPDYIDENILDNLKAYSADTIELGVQSFDEEVLRLSERGHDAECVRKSAALIKSYGFELGIQLMTGLPGDSLEKSVFSAEETVKLAPSIARIYPTIVVKGTRLYEEYLAGRYVPLTLDQAVLRAKEMYKILDRAGINVIRVGLKASDIMNEDEGACGGTFHPAFRQLVESEIAKETLEEKLDALRSGSTVTHVEMLSNRRSFSNMIGNSASNRKYFEEKYNEIRFSFGIDDSLGDGEYRVSEKV